MDPNGTVYTDSGKIILNSGESAVTPAIAASGDTDILLAGGQKVTIGKTLKNKVVQMPNEYEAATGAIISVDNGTADAYGTGTVKLTGGSVKLEDTDAPIGVTGATAPFFVDVPDGKPAVTVTNGIYAGSRYVLYKVANVSMLNGYAHFDKVGEYYALDDLDVSLLQNPTNAAWNAVAADVYEKTLFHNLEPTAANTVGEDGICRFDGLETGLYLVTNPNNETDPFLLCLPDLDIGTQNWSYDVTADPLSPTTGLLNPSAAQAGAIAEGMPCSLSLRTVMLDIPADGEADITVDSKTYRYINGSADSVTVFIRPDGTIRTILNDTTAPSVLPVGSYEACCVRTDGDTVSYTFLADLDAALVKANVKSGDIVFLNTAINPTTAGYVYTGDGIDIYTAQGNLAKNYSSRNDVDYEIAGVLDLHTVDSREQAKKYGLDQSYTPQITDYMYVKISNENENGHVEVQVTFPSYDEEAVAADENSDLVVVTENGTVKLDAATLDKLGTTAKDVVMSVRENEDGTVTVDVTVDGRTVDADVKVELPAVGEGQVLVIVKPDGTEEIVKKSLVEDGKAYAEIPAGATVKVVDNAMHFADVADNAWYDDAVEFVSSHGLFQGVGDGNFAPTSPMTRAMLATVLYRLEDAAATGTNPFSDVAAGTWYTDAVTWANAEGIVQGTDMGFEPDANITREQIATMLYRYAKTIGLDVSGSAELDKFSDGDKTSNWAKDAMQWAVSVGLFQGDEAGTLRPQGDATRAEVATLLMRMVKLIVK